MRYQALLTSLLVASALAARTPTKRQNAPAGAILQGVGVFIATSGTTSAGEPSNTAAGENPLTALGVSSGNEGRTEGEGEAPVEGEAPAEGESPAGGETPAEGEAASETASAGGEAATSEGEAKQEGGGGGVDDATVFNFAFTLERLETQFYQEAAATLDAKQWERLGISGGSAQLISDTLSAIAQDEATHTSTIGATLAAVGATANTQCSFDFTGAFNDPFTFLSVARALEETGLSAYHGAVPLIQDKSLLAAGASIATVESRHSSLLNLFTGGSAIPQAFDMALTPPEVLALVGGFLQDCTPEDLGLTSTPPLLVAAAQDGSSVINIGSQLAFASLANIDESNDFCQMLIGGQTQAVVQPVQNCVVSPNIATSGLKLDGQVFVWITKDATPIVADVNSRNLDNLVAGPALFFLDNASQRNQVFSAPLNIQALGSANLAISSFGSNISLNGGSKGQLSFQSGGYLSQNQVNYVADGRQQSKLDRGQNKVSRSNKRHHKSSPANKRRATHGARRLSSFH